MLHNYVATRKASTLLQSTQDKTVTILLSTIKYEKEKGILESVCYILFLTFFHSVCVFMIYVAVCH